MEFVLLEPASFIDDQVNALRAGRANIVLEWHWAVLSVDNMTRLVFDATDPFGEFGSIGNCSREEDVADLMNAKLSNIFTF